jgi:hypothetical protein
LLSLSLFIYLGDLGSLQSDSCHETLLIKYEGVDI